MSASLNPENSRVNVSGVLYDLYCHKCKREFQPEELFLCFVCGWLYCKRCWLQHRKPEVVLGYLDGVRATFKRFYGEDYKQHFNESIIDAMDVRNCAAITS